MTEKAFGGSTSALVDDRGDGTHVPVVKILGSTTGGGSSTSSTGGGIIGVDTEGTKWLLIADASKTPATITYIKVADGTAGTPVGGFTPDADQNGLTDAQLRATDVPVVTPLPAGPKTGQVKIATTGTAVPLPSNVLKNGVVIKAKSSNAQPLFVGASGVTTTDDGTGTGYKLEAGEAVSFAVANSNSIYINGTAGDSVYFAGN